MAPILVVGGFHTPDKHLIVGYREAGSGLPFISNNNDNDDSYYLLSTRHLTAFIACLVYPVLTAASQEGGSQQVGRRSTRQEAEGQ